MLGPKRKLVEGHHYALQELERRGVVDSSRIAVGGHSYGAFMAANLLAHAPELFACGIARSGAYNRCLHASLPPWHPSQNSRKNVKQNQQDCAPQDDCTP